MSEHLHAIVHQIDEPHFRNTGSQANGDFDLTIELQWRIGYFGDEKESGWIGMGQRVQMVG